VVLFFFCVYPLSPCHPDSFLNPTVAPQVVGLPPRSLQRCFEFYLHLPCVSFPSRLLHPPANLFPPAGLQYPLPTPQFSTSSIPFLVVPDFATLVVSTQSLPMVSHYLFFAFLCLTAITMEHWFFPLRRPSSFSLPWLPLLLKLTLGDAPDDS